MEKPIFSIVWIDSDLINAKKAGGGGIYIFLIWLKMLEGEGNHLIST